MTRAQVRDAAVWTSAGMTTGIDMTLAMITADLGQAFAMEIAPKLAVIMVSGHDAPHATCYLCPASPNPT